MKKVFFFFFFFFFSFTGIDRKHTEKKYKIYNIYLTYKLQRKKKNYTTLHYTTLHYTRITYST